jgi:hypothetical protein
MRYAVVICTMVAAALGVSAWLEHEFYGWRRTWRDRVIAWGSVLAALSVAAAVSMFLAAYAPLNR